MGSDAQQFEVRTLMKHGMDKFVDVLTSRELDLIAKVYDRMIWISSVVGTIPEWFATDDRGLFRSDKPSIGEGEEACLRQASTWVKLHHPHVWKFYGAHHVGTPFVVHELTVTHYPGIRPWKYMYGCALGLKHVHESGLAHDV
jgi:hypothetical protein